MMFVFEKERNQKNGTETRTLFLEKYQEETGNDGLFRKYCCEFSFGNYGFFALCYHIGTETESAQGLFTVSSAYFGDRHFLPDGSPDLYRSFECHKKGGQPFDLYRQETLARLKEKRSLFVPDVAHCFADSVPQISAETLNALPDRGADENATRFSAQEAAFIQDILRRKYPDRAAAYEGYYKCFTPRSLPFELKI